MREADPREGVGDDHGPGAFVAHAQQRVYAHNVAFFAEASDAALPDLHRSGQSQPVRQVAVVGHFNAVGVGKTFVAFADVISNEDAGTQGIL